MLACIETTLELIQQNLESIKSKNVKPLTNFKEKKNKSKVGSYVGAGTKDALK